MKVVTRFAPSPTGTLHIGGVRTALFNYVYAKKMGGLFLIRIEDTDRQRSTKEFEKNILDSLNSIGLSPDLVPINQSERTDIYTEAADEIYKGLVIKKSFEIHFPKAFTYFLKFLQMLPSSLYFKLVARGMKKIDY